MQYRREIDGLRTLAVLPVLFFHAGFDAFSGGFVGVDFYCDATTCRSVMDGRPLFRDTNHLSAHATRALESRPEGAILSALDVEKSSGRKSIDG